MISIKKIYEKYINYVHGQEQKEFIQMYEKFKLLVEEFDKQALALDGHKMAYNTHAQMKDKLNAHKKKMDDQVKTAKHIVRSIESHRLS